MKDIISTTSAPSAIGPYSQGVKFAGFVITSGQLPIDPKSGEMPADIKSQTKQSLENVKAVLAEAGLEMTDVVKTTVFLKNMDDFAGMNETYATYFSSNPPARSAIEVARLPKDALVEIEAFAYCN